jgi:hypothetical protein
MRLASVVGCSGACAMTVALSACGPQDLLSLGGGEAALDATVFDEPSAAPIDAPASDEPGGDDGPQLIIGDAGCTGLGCVNHKCPNGTHTTLSGTVYDPAGENPLYGVIVFIPDDPKRLPPITPGTHSCTNACTAPVGHYLRDDLAVVTDPKGAFSFMDVPTAKNIPLVIQTGKWRRIVNIPATADCADTVVSPSSSRLPSKRSEGDMPQMALLTGGCDDLGCFMRSIGIDPTEFSRPLAGGRLDVYQGINAPYGVVSGNGPNLTDGGAGNCTGSGCPLWTTKADLEHYDMVLLACECDEYTASKPASSMTALHDWLNEGGKVFATHFHYTWFKNGPSDFQGIATWLGKSMGSGSGTYTLDTSFQKGQVLATWLNNVGAATGSTIALTGVATSVSTVGSSTTRWIYDNATSPPDTKYLSLLTPIGGILPPISDAGVDGGADAGRSPQYCGKAVLTDLHTSGTPSGDVPGSCAVGADGGAALTPQQKALEFLFFDLSACVPPDETSRPPLPPPNTTQ